MTTQSPLIGPFLPWETRRAKAWQGRVDLAVLVVEFSYDLRQQSGMDALALQALGRRLGGESSGFTVRKCRVPAQIWSGAREWVQVDLHENFLAWKGRLFGAKGEEYQAQIERRLLETAKQCNTVHEAPVWTTQLISKLTTQSGAAVDYMAVIDRRLEEERAKVEGKTLDQATALVKPGRGRRRL